MSIAAELARAHRARRAKFFPASYRPLRPPVARSIRPEPETRPSEPDPAPTPECVRISATHQYRMIIVREPRLPFVGGNAEALRRAQIRTKTALIRETIARETRGTGFTFDDVRGPSRLKRLVAVRHAAIVAVAREFPELSLPAIGRIFGGRDHSTIIHALKKAGGR